MNKFWSALLKSANNVWQIADDAWKALRWNVAAAAAFAIYNKTLDHRALFLGFGLSLIAIVAMAAYLIRCYIASLTPKGREDRGIFSVIIAIFFFAVSIAFAIAVWSILVSLNLSLYG